MIKFLHRIIRDPNTKEAYLERWDLRLGFCSIKVHRILREDFGRALHDHPWWFMSFILTGGYLETLWRRGKTRTVRTRPGYIVHRDMKIRHRIAEVFKPCWTLVICGPKRRTWGFWPDGKFVPHHDYKDSGDEPMMME